jgi:uncharacterized protein (DUF58 family)
MTCCNCKTKESHKSMHLPVMLVEARRGQGHQCRESLVWVSNVTASLALGLVEARDLFSLVFFSKSLHNNYDTVGQIQKPRT